METRELMPDNMVFLPAVRMIMDLHEACGVSITPKEAHEIDLVGRTLLRMEASARNVLVEE